MDNGNSIGYHLRQIFRIASERMKDVFTERDLTFQAIAAVLYHVLFIILAYIFMRSEDDTLFKWGLILAPVYIFASFVFNIRKYIPWQIFFIFTSGALVEFILNVTHIIPEDRAIVLSGLGQSLWCAFIVLQVIVLFLFTLIPYIVYNHKNKAVSAKT
ncbi:MAG: hypothetical protein IKG30_13145 [Clostridiales bacterium]|nr:hypothetical protein [Clostridiales bacterium]